MAGALAVLGECGEGLVDEFHVGLVDVQSQQPQLARRAAADTVEELQRLCHKVVFGLVARLLPQVVLKTTSTPVYVLQMLFKY